MGHRSRGADGRARAAARFHGAEGGHASHARPGAHRHSHDRRRRRDADRRLSHMKRRGTHMGVRVTLGLVLVMTVLLVAGPALAQGKWSQLKSIPQGEEEVYGTPVPTPRGALSATAIGTKIYAIGGARNPSYSTPELRPSVPVENVATNEVYDTETNTWTLARPMLTARNHHGAALIDGKIYVVGGRIGSTFIIGLSNNVSTNEVYDIAKDTWASVLGMPTPRSGVGVAGLKGRIHLLGREA